MSTARSLTYEFRGKFDNLRSGLVAAGRSVEDFGTKLTALDAKGAKMRRGLTSLGDIGGKAGLLAAGGLAAIVGVTANFESAMSKVAATGDDARGSLNDLREAAIKAGADTAFSASEAAGGIEALLKAGVSAKDVLAGGLTGALDLAAAGELDVSKAAEIAATTMTQFALKGQDVSHIADVLAAAAGKAQGEVTDMADALNYVGPVAAQMGISLEETAGAIAELASQGILGSQAGTSLRGMLTSLTSPSKLAKETMDEYGISLYDAQGNMIGFDGIAQQLQESMGGLDNATRDQALGQIFGNEQITAARILYAGGAQDVQKWTAAVNDNGYAAETAGTKLDNLSGDLEQLKGSLETALIGAGEGSQGPLRKLVQTLTDVVNAFNKLPGPVQSSTTALLGLTAIVGGGLWFTSKVVNGIVNTREALANLGISADGTRGKLTGLVRVAGGLAAVGLAVTAINDAINSSNTVELSNLSRELEALAQGRSSDSFKQLGDDFKLLAKDANEAGKLWGSNTNEVKRETQTFFGLFGDTAADTALKNIEKFDQALADLVEAGQADEAAAAFDEISQAAENAGLSAGFVTDHFKQYTLALQNAGLELTGYQRLLAATGGKGNALTDILGRITGEATSSADATQSAAGANKQLGNTAQTAADKTRELAAAMLKQANAALDAFDAETSYRRAMKEAAKQADKNNAGIKGNSEAALNNRDSLSALASSWNNQSAAVRNNIAKFQEARKNFIQTAVDMRVPREEAKRLADQLLALPKNKVIPVETPGLDGAIHGAQVLRAAIDNLHDKSITITVTENRRGGSTSVYGGHTAENRATGGFISGPGTSTSDSIPARLSDGEYVVRAAAVERYGVGLFDTINAMRFANGGRVARFADGGSVDTRSGDNQTEREARKTGEALKGLRARLKEATDALNREKDARNAVVDKMKSLGSDVSGDLKSSLFGDVWSSGSGSGTLLSDIGSAREEIRAIRTLRHKGLSGGALAEVLSEGGLAGAQAYAEMSRQELHEFERLYNLRNRLTRRAGELAGTAAYGGALANSRQSVHALTSRLDRIEHQLKIANRDRKDEHEKDRKSTRRGAGNAARSRRRNS